jgi:hypothetical protein
MAFLTNKQYKKHQQKIQYSIQQGTCLTSFVLINVDLMQANVEETVNEFRSNL